MNVKRRRDHLLSDVAAACIVTALMVLVVVGWTSARRVAVIVEMEKATEELMQEGVFDRGALQRQVSSTSSKMQVPTDPTSPVGHVGVARAIMPTTQVLRHLDSTRWICVIALLIQLGVVCVVLSRPVGSQP